MTKNLTNRRSYRRRITNKKTKKTKKTKLKSKKKGGMYRRDWDTHTLATAAATAAPLEGPAVTPAVHDGVDMECNVYGAPAIAMDVIIEMLPPHMDVRNATLNLRPIAPTKHQLKSADAIIAAEAKAAAARCGAFDASLKISDIVELNSNNPGKVRWFGMVIAPNIKGVSIRWFEEVNENVEDDDNFLLKFDPLQPKCNTIRFDTNTIIGRLTWEN